MTSSWILVALACAPALPGAEPAPNIHGETIDQAARRTGYTREEIRECFPPIASWALEPRPGRLARTFARERFPAAPGPGVHPRVYFGPDELPAIRRRLKRTQVGRLQMAGIRARLLQLSPRGQDWESIPYKPTPADYARYAARGLHIQPRMGYRGPWVGGWLDALADGRVPADLDAASRQSPAKTARRYLMHLLPYEAFRCLIDEDAAGGRRVGAAAATIAKLFRREMARWTATDDWQRIYQLLSSQSLGLTYDWAHRWMTDAQRRVVRACIADITRGKRYLGLDHLPGFPGNTSNWNIIHANLLPMVLSIESEEGYDAAVYRRIVQGLRKWVYVASGPKGAPFEGFKKSNYAPQWLLPLARRGEPLIGTEYAGNHLRQFTLHVMVPWGGEYVYETQIDTVSRGADVFKFAHPGDPVIDAIYGRTVGDCFDANAVGKWLNVRTTYPPPYHSLLVADDPAGAAGGKYDWNAAFVKLLAHLRETNEPLTYFSDYRGLLTARSAWRADAVMLYFEPRNVPGGHTRASRNDFVVCGLGRKWSDRPPAVEATSEFQSIVLIDGKGQGKSGGRCPAGRTVALADEPLATFAAGDAADAYGHVLVSADHKQAKPIDVSPNDSRLSASRLPWMARPWRVLPNWATGCKPATREPGKPSRDPGGHGFWMPYNPVERAFRTCGLVRGASPYVVVVDDVRKDREPHEYAWQMQIQPDLKVTKALRAGAGVGGAALDLTLADGTGRRCLVRVLAAGDKPIDADVLKAAGLDVYEYERRGKKYRHNRLLVPVRSAVGRFRVLIFPYRQGTEPPGTAWSADGRTLTVEIGKQKDTFTFTDAADGRTRLALKRGGKHLLTLK